MKTPSGILKDEPNYKPAAWEGYELAELGDWVHLLVKRAGMRSDPVKAAKDLQDAENYHAMMGEFIAAKRREILG